MAGIFVIGTDTAVGKTFTSCLLLHFLRKRFAKVGAIKPFGTGAPSPSDAELLWEACGGKGPLPSWVCSFRFNTPQAPAQAAQREKSTIDLQKVRNDFAHAREKHDFLLVEGAGGLLVPLLPQNYSYTIENLALEFKLPVLLVARAGLGTLNHTLLTLYRCQQVGLRVCGIVLNQSVPVQNDPSVQDNAGTLRKITSLPIWGPLPYAHGIPPENLLDYPEVCDPIEQVAAEIWKIQVAASPTSPTSKVGKSPSPVIS